MTTMDPFVTIMYWITLIGAGLNLAISGLVLVRRRHVFPWLRTTSNPRRSAVGGLLLSIGLLTGTIPRLAHAPDLVILVASLVALPCFVAAAVMSFRSVHMPADVRQGGTATDAPEPGLGQPQQTT